MRATALWLSLIVVGCVPPTGWVGSGWNVAPPATPTPDVSTWWPGADRAPAPGQHLPVVVHRWGGRMVAGDVDDATRWISYSVKNAGRSEVNIPAFEGTDDEWLAMMSCTRAQYAGLAVDLVEQAPASGDYELLVVGGTAADFGLTGVWGWATIGDQTLVNHGVGFVFSADHHPRDRVIALCESVSHEIGHLLGLAHSDDCGDLMSVNGDCNNRDYEHGALRSFDESSRSILALSLERWATAAQLSEPERISGIVSRQSELVAQVAPIDSSTGFRRLPVALDVPKPLAHALLRVVTPEGYRGEYHCLPDPTSECRVDGTHLAGSYPVGDDHGTWYLLVEVTYADGSMSRTPWYSTIN